MGSHANTVTYDVSAGKDGRRVYSRKREEYLADFCLISRRALSDLEYRVFRYHYVLGADCNLCARQMKITRGEFFHLVYRVQETLGRAFAETKPYGIYPLREYFGGIVEKFRPGLASTPSPKASKRRPIQPAIAMNGGGRLRRIA